MSRSRRKTPIIGIVKCESEKQEKRAYNRRYRHAIRMILRRDAEPETLPHLYDYSDVWKMGKDWKQCFDPKEHPASMRK